MTLAETLDRALEATAGLQAAVGEADLATCHRLVAERGEIMDLFENAHRAADEAEKAACGPAIARLQEADRSLLVSCQEALARLHADFRRGLDSSRPARQQNVVREACLNRTA